MLKWNDKYEAPIAELEAGTTIRLDHDSCPAGEDTRGRLYITRPATGNRVLAYCHNCQDGASWRIKEGYRPTWAGYIASTATTEFTSPVLTTDRNHWPDDMIDHLCHYNLHLTKVVKAGIAYDPNGHSIYMPIYDQIIFDKDSSEAIQIELKGYQLRPLQRTGPKYTTVMKDSAATMHTLMTNAHPTQETGVVVEDFLSGLKIIMAAQKKNVGVQVLVNYGTKVDPFALSKFDCSNLCVWLDNDNHHVKGQAKIMCRTLGLIHSKPTRMITIELDPKETSLVGIYRELEWTV